MDSNTDTAVINQTYSMIISGLEPGTTYYLRVVAVFDMFSKRQSDITFFRTKETGKAACTNLCGVCHSTFIIITTEQAYYLEYLNITDIANVVQPCLNGCSSPEIILPYDFPYGGYYHQTAYVRHTHKIQCST